MNKKYFVLSFALVLFFVLLLFAKAKKGKVPSPTNFNECVSEGNPVMESYPRKCRSKSGDLFVEQIETTQVTNEGTNTCLGMSIDSAKEIARTSECGNIFKNTFFCNENTKTWWIDLDIEKEGCSPACVVNVESKDVEINWRCTGLVSQ